MVGDRQRCARQGLVAQATVLWTEDCTDDAAGPLRTFRFELEVQLPGGEPFTASVRDRFARDALRPWPFDVIAVRVDPVSREVVFDLEDDPRYDVLTD
jgi:hypothetical protein